MAEKAKRTTRTPEERIAKLEATLAEARTKVQARTKKAAEQLQNKRQRHLDAINKANGKIEEIDTQLEELGFAVDEGSGQVYEASGEVTISTETEDDGHIDGQSDLQFT